MAGLLNPSFVCKVPPANVWRGTSATFRGLSWAGSQCAGVPCSRLPNQRSLCPTAPRFESERRPHARYVMDVGGSGGACARAADGTSPHQDGERSAEEVKVKESECGWHREFETGWGLIKLTLTLTAPFEWHGLCPGKDERNRKFRIGAFMTAIVGPFCPSNRDWPTVLLPFHQPCRVFATWVFLNSTFNSSLISPTYIRAR